MHIKPEAESSEGSLRAALHFIFPKQAKARRLPAKQNIVRDREGWDEIDLLINGADPERFGGFRRARIDLLSLEPDCSSVARKHSREDLDESAFAGAVLAHQSVHFAGADGEVHTLQRSHARETFDETPYLQQ